MIGEHTDYNGGHVFLLLFPWELTVQLASVTIKFCVSTQLTLRTRVLSKCLSPTSSLKKEHNWTNYPKGVLHFLQEAGHVIDKGFDFYVYGNIPNGAGLSSSASLELLTGVVAEHLFDLKLERLDLVKIGKQTENNFIGVNSGIMDQFAIGMGADQRAIYLDTNNLEYDLVPLDLKGQCRCYHEH